MTFSPASFLAGAAIGSLVGAIALARWWGWHIRKPEVCQRMLQTAYRLAHPHWLQISRDDTTPVCPCCGWHPTKSAQKAAPETPPS
jgi:hypothetical protein